MQVNFFAKFGTFRTEKQFCFELSSLSISCAIKKQVYEFRQNPYTCFYLVTVHVVLSNIRKSI